MASNIGRRRPLLSAALLVLGLSSLAEPLGAAERPKCADANLATLRRFVPEGFSIYQRLTDKNNFTFWFQCQDQQIDLTNAVHEGAHILTTEIQAYPLIDGRTVPLVGESRKLFRPGLVAPRFPAASPFVANYLMPGQASSADHFGFLLDELNAYSHDLNAATKLRHLSRPDNGWLHRDGLAALMAFTAAYVERARLEDRETWAILRSGPVKQTVATLWSQAEHVMSASCRIPRYADEAPEYLKPVCAANIRHGLGHLLGRPPLCPVSCLKALADGPAQRAASIPR